MRNNRNKLIHTALAAAVALAVTTAMPGGAENAHADPRPGATSAPVAPSSHTSVIRIKDSRKLPVTRGV